MATMGCNEPLADRVYDYVNRNDIPFTENDSGTGVRNLDVPGPWQDQPIYHIEDPRTRTSINRTLDGHIFHPGHVTHRVYFQRRTLYYEVIGSGQGGLPGFNNMMGVQLFQPGIRDVIERFGR